MPIIITVIITVMIIGISHYYLLSPKHVIPLQRSWEQWCLFSLFGWWQVCSCTRPYRDVSTETLRLMLMWCSSQLGLECLLMFCEYLHICIHGCLTPAIATGIVMHVLYMYIHNYPCIYSAATKHVFMLYYYLRTVWWLYYINMATVVTDIHMEIVESLGEMQRT